MRQMYLEIKSAYTVLNCGIFAGLLLR